MRWNQINIDWPDRPLRLCAPGRDSGTYDMFNKAINGDPANARQDVVSSEDDLVLVKCVASDPNAVGYFGYSYYATNREKLKALTVVGPRGPVSPSPRTVQNETYLPLSRPLFLYVNDQVLLQNEPGRRFLNWTLRHGLRLTEKVGLIPLPASTYRLAETKLYRRVLGTAFGGELAVGNALGDLVVSLLLFSGAVGADDVEPHRDDHGGAQQGGEVGRSEGTPGGQEQGKRLAHAE